MDLVILGTVLIVSSVLTLVIVPFFCDPGVKEQDDA